MLVDIDGTRRKAWLFLMRLMYSGRDFAWIYERQDQISFLDGHVRAFAHFGGVPAWVADATLDGTRKAYLAALAAVPLLIIDGLGMRKLPDTAAEDPLEIIMRRYERAATLLTSNRPVDDWRKLLGIWTSMDMDSRLGSRTFPAPNDYTDQPGAILVSARSAVEFRFCDGPPQGRARRVQHSLRARAVSERCLGCSLARRSGFLSADSRRRYERVSGQQDS